MKQALCIAITVIATSMTGCATFWDDFWNDEYEGPFKEITELRIQQEVLNQQIEDYNQQVRETSFLSGLFGAWDTLEKKREELEKKRNELEKKINKFIGPPTSRKQKAND